MPMSTSVKKETESPVKMQSELTQSVMGSLANFVPADKYLRQNARTPLGVQMEGECILNDQCIPLALSEYEQGKKALPAKTAR